MSEIFDCSPRALEGVPGCFGWSQRGVDGGVVVRVAGELDLLTAAELRQRLATLVESGHAAPIVLDLSDVRYIDAHSVGLIMNAWAAVRSRGGRLAVEGLRGIPAKVFDLLGLAPLVAQHSGEDTAGRGTRDRRRQTHRGAERRHSDGGANEAG